MNSHTETATSAWRLQMLKLLEANPGLSQRQLAVKMGISLGKANYCLRALVEKGLVKLGNFGKNHNKRHYSYILTSAGLTEKTRITLAFLKRKEAEFEAIKKEIDMLKCDLLIDGRQAEKPTEGADRWMQGFKKIYQRVEK